MATKGKTLLVLQVEEGIKKAGDAAKLAEIIGVSRPAVLGWLRGSEPVASNYMQLLHFIGKAPVLFSDGDAETRKLREENERLRAENERLTKWKETIQRLAMRVEADESGEERKAG